MKVIKRLLTILLVITIIASICVFTTISSSAQGTGIGLSEWALNAYNSGWSYVYGGCTPGTVDCSGLIYSYVGCERCGDPQLDASPESGSLSSLPNIHGLGLWQPGHVGIYIGSGLAVDARNEYYGVCCESVWSHGWTYWFKVNGVSYPTNGWEKCNGEYFYYEDGEYITNTSREIDGTTYYFDSSGASSTSPNESEYYNDNDSEDNSSSNESSETPKSLKYGSNGSEVEKLQERLTELGYYTGAIDGEFGKATEEAFKAFQKAMGLTVDGIAGSDIEYLFASDAPEFGLASSGSTNQDENDVKETENTKEEKENDSETKDSFVIYKKGEFNDNISRIQQRLIQLGYFAGEADGSFGSDTEAAIKAFQKANNLEVNGIADEATQKALFANNVVINETPEEETTPVQKKVEVPKVKPVKNQPKQQVSTELELKQNELSSKALAKISDKMALSDKDGNNYGFLFWLVVLIGVFSVALIIVYIIERKKMKTVKKDIKHFK